MRVLYHFPMSPFSRRVRLALMHKRLEAELRDGREKPQWVEEARRLVPQRTLPVLADGSRALGDSNAIAHWLDKAYPSTSPLWPSGDDALTVLEVAALVDVVLNTTVDLGTRYFPLSHDPAWGRVRAEMLDRIQRAFEALAARASSLGRPTIAASGWSAGDMWLYAAIAWFEGMPARAATNQNVAQVLTLGVTVPDALSRWADAHRERPDVLSL